MQRQLYELGSRAVMGYRSNAYRKLNLLNGSLYTPISLSAGSPTRLVHGLNVEDPITGSQYINGTILIKHT